ncbi:MAG: PD-(D/E)XK nuclease domain-containing protein, partial [Treponema sp.]|nr:PD-(D/E)XK nuclease domain-containing protein [Treponema sp.]
DAIFIFELKMDKGRDAEEIAQTALKQIDQKGYAAPFLASGKPVHKVAFVFSSSGEGLVSWKNK